MPRKIITEEYDLRNSLQLKDEKVQQGDSVELRVQFFDRGDLLDISKAKVILHITKEDNTFITQSDNIKIKYHEAIIKVNDAATNTKGMTLYEIRIFDSNGTVSTFRKRVYVEESILSNKVPSENIVTAVKELNDAVEKGMDIIAKLEEAMPDTNASEEELKALKISIDEINNKIKGKRVNILSFGAKGDESNDYEAFKKACEAAGTNGKVVFPETEKNKYFIDSNIKIEFKNLPILEFENPNSELRMNFTGDLKEAKLLTPFTLVSKDRSKVINVNPLENKFNIRTQFIEPKKAEYSKDIDINTLELVNIKGTDFLEGKAIVSNETIEFQSELGDSVAVKAKEYGGVISAMVSRKRDEEVNGNLVAYAHMDEDYYICRINIDKMTFSIEQNINGLSEYIVSEDKLPEACRLGSNKEVEIAVKGIFAGGIAFYLNGVLFYGNWESSYYAVKIKLGLGYDYRYVGKATISNFIEIESDKYNRNIQNKEKRYISLGDNITFGEDRLKPYPEIIGELLYRHTNREIEVVNYGELGQTAEECLKFVKENLDKIKSDDFITINIGSQEVEKGMDRDLFKSNLLEIVELLKSKTSNIYLTTLCIADESVLKYNPIINKVAAIKSVGCIDLFNEVFSRYNLFKEDKLSDTQYIKVAKSIASRLF